MQDKGNNKQCKAATLKGARCKNTCVLGTNFCWRHLFLREKVHPAWRILRLLIATIVTVGGIFGFIAIIWPSALDFLHPKVREIKIKRLTILSKIAANAEFFCSEGVRMDHNTFGTNPRGIDYVFPEMPPDSVMAHLKTKLAIILVLEVLSEENLPITKLTAQLNWNSRKWKRADSISMVSVTSTEKLAEWPVLVQLVEDSRSIENDSKSHNIRSSEITLVVDTLIMDDTLKYVPIEKNTLEEQLGEMNSFYVDIHRASLKLSFFTGLSSSEKLRIPDSDASITLAPLVFVTDSTLCFDNARYSAIEVVVDTVLRF